MKSSEVQRRLSARLILLNMGNNETISTQIKITQLSMKVAQQIMVMVVKQSLDCLKEVSPTQRQQQCESQRSYYSKVICKGHPECQQSSDRSIQSHSLVPPPSSPAISSGMQRSKTEVTFNFRADFI